MSSARILVFGGQVTENLIRTVRLKQETVYFDKQTKKAFIFFTPVKNKMAQQLGLGTFLLFGVVYWISFLGNKEQMRYHWSEEPSTEKI